MKKEIVEIKVKEFAKKFGEHLLFVLSNMKKNKNLFLDSPFYGLSSKKENPGMHCVRLDLLQTKNGWIVNEMDFVPSGRGFTAKPLPENERNEFLQVFADWYNSSKFERILYSVGEKTICLPEIEFFSEEMRKLGINIQTHILKDNSLSQIDSKKTLIDRLFYKTEVYSGIDQLEKFAVSTAESWLDSKGFFAFFWDQKNLLNLEKKTQSFFQKHFPYSIFLDNFSEEKKFQHYIESTKDKWLVKATDVEEDYSWGARGVLLGAHMSQKQFNLAISGFSKKELGARPILQEFLESDDFSWLWNSVVKNEVVFSGDSFGLASAKKEIAVRKVYARVGVFILINTKANKIFVPPFGEITLRQHEISHGSSDAIYLPYRLI